MKKRPASAGLFLNNNKNLYENIYFFYFFKKTLAKHQGAEYNEI